MTLKRFNESVSGWINVQGKLIFRLQKLDPLHILLSLLPHLLKQPASFSRCVQQRQPEVILIMKCHFNFLCIT